MHSFIILLNLAVISRAKFFEKWVSQGTPEVLWISAFFSPQTLLTRLLQNYSKLNKLPFEEIALKYEVTDVEDIESPEKVLYLYCIIFKLID